jgi:lipid-binding SYLF domain-containing protein
MGRQFIEPEGCHSGFRVVSAFENRNVARSPLGNRGAPSIATGTTSKYLRCTMAETPFIPPELHGFRSVTALRSRSLGMERRHFLAGSFVALGVLALGAGCSSSPPTAAEATGKKREIDAGADAALTRLYGQTRGSRELVQKAQGVLVFPSVLSAGIGIGGEYGEGVLRSGGRTIGYYKTTTGSLGATLGAQSKAVIILFMTNPAYQQFVSSSGWTAGADASVAVAETGADGSVDTRTASAPVIGFVLTNTGLMFNLSLNGTKVSKLDI